jgi:hypothetical protein
VGPSPRKIASDTPIEGFVDDHASDTPITVWLLRPSMPTCSEDDCDRVAAVRVYVPWAEDRDVCPAHARAIVQQDGVVADPLSGQEDRWP